MDLIIVQSLASNYGIHNDGGMVTQGIGGVESRVGCDSLMLQTNHS